MTELKPAAVNAVARKVMKCLPEHQEHKTLCLTSFYCGFAPEIILAAENADWLRDTTGKDLTKTGVQSPPAQPH